MDSHRQMTGFEMVKLLTGNASLQYSNRAVDQNFPLMSIKTLMLCARKSNPFSWRDVDWRSVLEIVKCAAVYNKNTLYWIKRNQGVFSFM
jgi:hypothetical protein